MVLCGNSDVLQAVCYMEVCFCLIAYVLVATPAANSSAGVQEGCPTSERVATPSRRRNQDFEYRCTGNGKGDDGIDAFICHLASPKTTRDVHTHTHTHTHTHAHTHTDT